MKKFFVTGVVLFSSFSAFADFMATASVSKIKIQCSTPQGFAGQSASVLGTLKLSVLPDGATKAVGKLKIALLDPKNPWSGTKNVIGQYDDLTGVGSDRYFHGGAVMSNEDDIMVIYANFSQPDLSYIEYAGETYRMSCK